MHAINKISFTVTTYVSDCLKLYSQVSQCILFLVYLTYSKEYTDLYITLTVFNGEVRWSETHKRADHIPLLCVSAYKLTTKLVHTADLTNGKEALAVQF